MPIGTRPRLRQFQTPQRAPRRLKKTIDHRGLINARRAMGLRKVSIFEEDQGQKHGDRCVNRAIQK